MSLIALLHETAAVQGFLAWRGPQVHAPQSVGGTTPCDTTAASSSKHRGRIASPKLMGLVGFNLTPSTENHKHRYQTHSQTNITPVQFWRDGQIVASAAKLAGVGPQYRTLPSTRHNAGRRGLVQAAVPLIWHGTNRYPF